MAVYTPKESGVFDELARAHRVTPAKPLRALKNENEEDGGARRNVTGVVEGLGLVLSESRVPNDRSFIAP